MQAPICLWPGITSSRRSRSPWGSPNCKEHAAKDADYTLYRRRRHSRLQFSLGRWSDSQIDPSDSGNGSRRVNSRPTLPIAGGEEVFAALRHLSNVTSNLLPSGINLCSDLGPEGALGLPRGGTPKLGVFDRKHP